jgi:hypothetical protein
MIGFMRTMLALLCLIAFTMHGFSPLLAEEPVSPSEFREYAEGHTLYFDRGGKPFGSEAFEPGGATVWRYLDGSCLKGAWRPHGAQLCFFYGDPDEVLCWRLVRDEEGLLVRLLGEGEGEDAGMELRVIRRDERKPICGEPGRGT